MDYAIEVINLKKSYKGSLALKGVSFSMRKGDILAFLGPNGAGKTTAINIMTGLIRPDSGQILYYGQPFNPRDSCIKRNAGIVPQHNNLERDLNLEKNLKIHGYLFGMRGNALKTKINEVLEIVGLTDEVKKTAGELSGGMKRRLVIARALMHDPSILFLDEPSTGLDPLTRRSIHALIRRLNRDRGVSVFLTTHYIEEADALSSKVIFINQGEISAEGDPMELKGSVGSFALEYMDGEELAAQYFRTREEAFSAARYITGSVHVREVTLEDAYIKHTGNPLAAHKVKR